MCSCPRRGWQKRKTTEARAVRTLSVASASGLGKACPGTSIAPLVGARSTSPAADSADASAARSANIAAGDGAGVACTTGCDVTDACDDVVGGVT